MSKQKTDPEELERNHVAAILERHRNDLEQGLYEIRTKYGGDWELDISDFLVEYYRHNSGGMRWDYEPDFDAFDPDDPDYIVGIISRHHKEMIDEAVLAIREDRLCDNNF